MRAVFSPTEDSLTDYYSDEQATFGDRLAAARTNQGMTQKQLAERLGVKNKSIAAWEDDANEPRANKLQMIAGILNISIIWLLTGEGEGVREVSTDDDGSELAKIIDEIRAVRYVFAVSTQKLAKLERRLRSIQGA
jgi:transcriptional regulator with XRE-family HTH domain